MMWHKHLFYSKVIACQWLDYPRNFTLIICLCFAYSIRFYSFCKQYNGKWDTAVQILPEKRIFQCLLYKAWNTCARHALPCERLRLICGVIHRSKALLKLSLSTVLNNVLFTLHSFIYKLIYACWMTLKCPDHSCSTCFITKVSTMRGFYEESTEFWPKQTN